MILNDDEIAILERSYGNLKIAEKEYKGKFKRCEICNGNGLKDAIKLSNGSFSWGGEYCDNCNGTGIIESNIDEVIFICNDCKGTGFSKDYRSCAKCNGTGLVDWVRNLRGSSK